MAGRSRKKKHAQKQVYCHNSLLLAVQKKFQHVYVHIFVGVWKCVSSEQI